MFFDCVIFSTFVINVKGENNVKENSIKMYIYVRGSLAMYIGNHCKSRDKECNDQSRHE